MIWQSCDYRTFSNPKSAVRVYACNGMCVCVHMSTQFCHMNDFFFSQTMKGDFFLVNFVNLIVAVFVRPPTQKKNSSVSNNNVDIIIDHMWIFFRRFFHLIYVPIYCPNVECTQFYTSFTEKNPKMRAKNIITLNILIDATAKTTTAITKRQWNWNHTFREKKPSAKFIKCDK